MAKERVIRTGREGINLFDLLPPQQPGTSSRLRSRRGMPIMFEPPTTEAQPLLANMGQQQNMLGLVDRPMVDTSMPSEGLMQNVSSTPNIFDIDNEKEIKEEIELKKQTKFGDAMARIGGGITLSEEQRKGLSPTAREKYNQERLSARNKGIAEMLFVLSDALAGRDVIGRAMGRQQARLPKEKSAREKINEELLRVYRALEEVGGNPEKLPAYEKAIYDARIANQTGYGFPGGFGKNLSSAGNSLPIITTQEEYDALAPGTRYIEEDGQEYTKPETT